MFSLLSGSIKTGIQTYLLLFYPCNYTGKTCPVPWFGFPLWQAVSFFRHFFLHIGFAFCACFRPEMLFNTHQCTRLHISSGRHAFFQYSRPDIML